MPNSLIDIEFTTRDNQRHVISYELGDEHEVSDMLAAMVASGIIDLDECRALASRVSVMAAIAVREMLEVERG